MTSCTAGAPSGRYILTGKARAEYDDSALGVEDEEGSVEAGRIVGRPEAGVEGGMGRGIKRDAMRVYRSWSSEGQLVP